MDRGIQTALVLPFGKHKDKPLSEVPAGYLQWAIETCKLSSGLRAAVAEELTRRGVEAPAPPAPVLKIPPCRRCDSDRFRVAWQEDRNGGRRIRASCSCGAYLCFLPLVEPWVSLANNAVNPTAALDVLIALGDLGIDLRSDGKTVWLAGEDRKRVPENLHVLIRQCCHQLVVMLGNNWRMPQ
jgi:hypothetical protein